MSWVTERDAWISAAKPREILRVILKVAEGFTVDETGGDYTERMESIMWLASRGHRGGDWGHAGAALEIDLE